MTKLRLTSDLMQAARRCVWFKSPEEAVAFPAHLVAHILTYGAYEDVRALRRQLTDDDLREAIDHAPPGVFDPRSWTYWNLMLGRDEAPPMPQRRFE